MSAALLELYVPGREDLRSRQEMLSDPATMSYNKGYGLDMAAYHNDTGCIDFPEESWDSWSAKWLNAEPERFYAYLRRKADGAFLGEANLCRTAEPGWYEMGIVLKAEHRGKGYSRPGLDLLLDRAFTALNASGVQNRFEETRTAAGKLHRAVGFVPAETENGVTLWRLSRERYEALQR